MGNVDGMDKEIGDLTLGSGEKNQPLKDIIVKKLNSLKHLV